MELEENKRIGIYVSADVEKYIEQVKEELKPIYGRVSMGMAVSEIVRRQRELEKKIKEYEEK